MSELNHVLKKFVDSKWELVATPSQNWLDGKHNKQELISAIEQANAECGKCGCKFDPIYKQAMMLLNAED